MSAFVPVSGLFNVTGMPVQRASAVAPFRRASSAHNGPIKAPTMVSYPYTGSGYGGCGVPYANNKVGQFFTKTETADIVDTAASLPIFSTLVSLLRSTGLDYELKKAGPFTVFAPTDDAFAALLEPHSFSVYSSLLRPENKDTAAKVLLYHVLPGELQSGGIAPLGGKVTATTLSGDKITVMAYNRLITAGSAKVIRKDIPCSNGVIHIIDSVLTPMSYETPPIVPQPSLYYDSIVTDYYGKLLTPRQALGIDPAPESVGAIAKSN